MHSDAVRLGGPLRLEDVEDVAVGRRRAELPEPSRVVMERSRHAIESLCEAADQAPAIYGVNTGFGALAETRIAAADVERLQLNLLRSHAVGVGPPLSREQVRAMMLLRAQALALGRSGVRPALVETLLAMLDRDVVPVVPAQGSVGASGDLAPLAHLALVLVGEGEALFEGRRLDGAEALRRAGLEPLRLGPKEGLSLVNGTQMMLAVGALALLEAERLCALADVTGAMSLDALEGSGRPFDPRIAECRPHPGHRASADNLRVLLDDSAIMESHRDCKKVQDPYSLRCMPQVHGASRDALAWARGVLERETVAATDNPLVFVDDGGRVDVLSGGNFHGQPLALALDLAAMAVAELGAIAERRIEQLVNPALSSGLPPFLAPRTGLDSGFMMAQVTAAALVSENKVLCHPASVDSIPSSAGKEDHVSMGSIAARKLARVVEHVRVVLAIEALVAAQGLDHRLPRRGGRGVRAAHDAIRSVCPPLQEDRALHRDVEAAVRLFESGALRSAVEAATGPLR
ncbi:MAG: histidine ammonia-lyase [Myxococcota bacterium]|nr:histidine ammonia-lyase [Myxococcota bacterium]MDW8361195.1 histidine ammonia-lyase [Myxococcales bacterium]